MFRATLPLRLVDLPPGHSTHHGRLTFAALDAAEEEEPYAVEVSLDVDALGSRVHIRGTVRGTAQSICHRCLNRFGRTVEAAFELILQKGVTGADSEDIVSVPENAAEYDLAPHVHEAVILEEPIRLVCRPDCAGLCPQCGGDLNQGACGCAPTADPRWSPLERLRRQLE
jgi:DUF177 domain-containing protein